MLEIKILTAYPEIFPGTLGYSILGKALEEKKWSLASDLLEVENNFQKKYYIPMDDDNVMNVDTRNKIIIVNPMLGILE